MFLPLWLYISDQHMYNWKDTAKSSLFVLSYNRKENLAVKELFVGIFQISLVIFLLLTWPHLVLFFRTFSVKLSLIVMFRFLIFKAIKNSPQKIQHVFVFFQVIDHNGLTEWIIIDNKVCVMINYRSINQVANRHSNNSHLSRNNNNSSSNNNNNNNNPFSHLLLSKDRYIPLLYVCCSNSGSLSLILY